MWGWGRGAAAGTRLPSPRPVPPGSVGQAGLSSSVVALPSPAAPESLEGDENVHQACASEGQGGRVEVAHTSMRSPGGKQVQTSDGAEAASSRVGAGAGVAPVPEVYWFKSAGGRSVHVTLFLTDACASTPLCVDRLFSSADGSRGTGLKQAMQSGRLCTHCLECWEGRRASARWLGH